MDALDWQLALGRAPGLTARLLRAALAALGTARWGMPETGELLGQRGHRTLQSLGWPPAACAALQAPDGARIAADRRWVERERIVLVNAADPFYPPLLAHLPTAPALLYVRGDAASLATPQLAIVGSRNPTQPGRRTAQELAAHLSRAGLTITSGLALGIDAAGHEGALRSSGRTVAVLGSGLDDIYPPQHRGLAGRIAARGALVSEFPPGTPPLRANFPHRNRIISGLSVGTLVVEAARRSGSLITARLAGDAGREVFAVPGSIHNPLARGCHALIRAGAKLVENAADILEELRFTYDKQYVMFKTTGPGKPANGPGALDKEYKILLDALGFEPASLDSLVERTGLPSQSVASMLLILELEGTVGLHAGGRYVRL